MLYLVVLGFDVVEFGKDGLVEGVKKGVYLGELFVFYGVEDFLEEVGLFFYVLEGEGGVGFEVLEVFVDLFEE